MKPTSTEERIIGQACVCLIVLLNKRANIGKFKFKSDGVNVHVVNDYGDVACIIDLHEMVSYGLVYITSKFKKKGVPTRGNNPVQDCFPIHYEDELQALVKEFDGFAERGLPEPELVTEELHQLLAKSLERTIHGLEEYLNPDFEIEINSENKTIQVLVN